MRVLNEIARFLLELLALAGFGFGIGGHADGLLGVLVGLAVVVVAGGVWGWFLSPKAPRRPADPTRFIAEAAFFVAAGAAYATFGSPFLAASAVIVAVLNAVLVRVLDTPGRTSLMDLG